MTPKQQAALELVAPAAVAAERASAAWLGVGFPADVIVAQWGAETGWSFDKVTGDWNLFGLTAAACPGRPKKFCPTTEELTIGQFSVLPFDERESVTKREDLGHGRYRYHLSRWFACFDSLDQAITSYIQVIVSPGHRYYSAWQAYMRGYSVDQLLDGIAHSGFASGSGYDTLLHQLAHQNNVQAAIQAARGKRVS